MTQKKILIVDDMQFDRELMKKALSRSLTCDIIEAASGNEALQKLATNTIDLVLLDVDMPELTRIMNGAARSGLPDAPYRV